MTNVSTNEMNPSQSTSVIPVTPTEILNSKVAALVERYRFFAKASAENVIALAKTIVEADSQLRQDELEEFCREAGINRKSATYRKLKDIGLKADRFETHLDRLPSAWTTVYKLAALPEQDFEKVVTNDAFSPTMTAKSISTIVGSVKKASSKQDNAPKASSPDVPKAPLPDVAINTVVPALVVNEPLTSPKTITLNLEGLDASDISEVYENLLIMKADKQFTFEMSNGMRAFVNSERESLFQMEQAA
jgi:hypothetical protein